MQLSKKKRKNNDVHQVNADFEGMGTKPQYASWCIVSADRFVRHKPKISAIV